MNAIVAVNNKGYIGANGKLMWKSSADFQHFKELTKGGICLVGWRTWAEDLKFRILAGRIMVVLGKPRDEEERELSEKVKIAYGERLVTTTSMWEAVTKAYDISKEKNIPIWCIGGGMIYEQLMPLFKEIHVSIINENQEGDVMFDIPEDFRGLVFKYFFECDV